MCAGVCVHTGSGIGTRLMTHETFVLVDPVLMLFGKDAIAQGCQ